MTTKLLAVGKGKRHSEKTQLQKLKDSRNEEESIGAEMQKLNAKFSL